MYNKKHFKTTSALQGLFFLPNKTLPKKKSLFL